MKLAEQVKQDYTQYKAQVKEQGAFTELRDNAFAEFEKNGFPTTRHEEWKYTNLQKISAGTFQSTCVSFEHGRGLLSQLAINSIAGNRLVFINGTYQAELSEIIETDSSIVISTIARARKEHNTLFEKHFGRYAAIEGQALNAMNTALLSDGAFIYVPDGKHVSAPVVLIHICDSGNQNVLQQPRNLVIADKSTSLTLIEAYHATGQHPAFTNVVSEIYAGSNCTLELYKVQDEAGENYHNNFTQVFQEADSTVNQVTVTLNGTLVRNNLHFFMNGENCNTLLYGLYVTHGKNHVDNHTRVDHAMPYCNSNELYKGVLNDQSTAVFNGKVIVHKDAQKTNAYQRNQNILISGEATINTKPQLEIFADDVKCTHGATVGELNSESLFYLRSRGIPEHAAKRMLLNAFAEDITGKIRVTALAEILAREIENRV